MRRLGDPVRVQALGRMDESALSPLESVSAQKLHPEKGSLG
jgi:hypothetical protein